MVKALSRFVQALVTAIVGGIMVEYIILAIREMANIFFPSGEMAKKVKIGTRILRVLLPLAGALQVLVLKTGRGLGALGYAIGTLAVWGFAYWDTIVEEAQECWTYCKRSVRGCWSRFVFWVRARGMTKSEAYRAAEGF